MANSKKALVIFQLPSSVWPTKTVFTFDSSRSQTTVLYSISFRRHGQSRASSKAGGPAAFETRQGVAFITQNCN
jgi:hypothetical protein